MRSHPMIRGTAALASCAALLSAPAFAQPLSSATITGQVTDAASGDALEGVTVIATSPDLQASRQVKTDKSGWYRLSQLPVGTYTVTYARNGFKLLRYTGVDLRSGQTARLNAELSPRPEQAPATSSDRSG